MSPPIFVSKERTHPQDVNFGIRQLTDNLRRISQEQLQDLEIHESVRVLIRRQLRTELLKIQEQGFASEDTLARRFVWASSRMYHVKISGLFEAYPQLTWYIADMICDSLSVPSCPGSQSRSQIFSEHTDPLRERFRSNNPEDMPMEEVLSSGPSTDDWKSLHGELFKQNCVDVLNKHHSKSTTICMKGLLARIQRLPPTAYVFISHCTKDHSERVFQAVKSAIGTAEPGHEVFNPTTRFAHARNGADKRAMQNAAAKSGLLVAALSPGFFKSKWCLAEIQAAVEANVPIVPVYSGEYDCPLVEEWTCKKYFGYVSFQR